MSGRTWFGRLLLGFTVSVGLAIVVAAMLVLHSARQPAPERTSVPASVPFPDRGVIGILGVLQRPQKKADLELGPQLSRVLHGSLSAIAAPIMSGIRLAAITPWGAKIFLVPARPQAAQMIAKLSPAQRAAAARRRAVMGWNTGMRVATLGAGGGCCLTAAAIEADHAWSSGGARSLNYVIIVVPDGVERVTIGLPHPVSALVQGNIAAFKVPEPIENPTVYPIVWYGPEGSVVKEFSPSRRSTSAG